ncbi:hypothetical protein A0H81_14755 [Grifola frondosa]|uniref:Uncharacterized protein n=1 Tax=Grifola frondosa TaxID=5627 RepID=A0A1C7LL04_GRIFR|nr:hypothetical protein A0H81_14755 [Grifola frondosa]
MESALRGRGMPLWEPEPTGPGEVLLGDVGYMGDGGFYRLFNTTRGPDDPIHAQYGVPDGFEQFTYVEHLCQERKHAIPPGPLCSRNIVKIDVEGSFAIGTGEAIGGGCRFKCTDEQGAERVTNNTSGPTDEESTGSGDATEVT